MLQGLPRMFLALQADVPARRYAGVEFIGVQQGLAGRVGDDHAIVRLRAVQEQGVGLHEPRGTATVAAIRARTARDLIGGLDAFNRNGRKVVLGYGKAADKKNGDCRDERTTVTKEHGHCPPW